MYRPYPCDFCENEICLENQHCKVLDYYNANDIRYYAGMSLKEAENFLDENLKINVFGNVPNVSNFIVCSNHTSYIDPIVIKTALDKIRVNTSDMTVLAAKEVIALFNNLLTGLNAVSVDRVNNPFMAIKATETLLKESEYNKIIIFPEGTRSRTGRLQELKAGVGQIAVDLSYPILPIYIDGAFDFWSPNDEFPSKKRDNINVYLLDMLYTTDGKNRKEIMKELSESLLRKEEEVLNEHRS